MARGRKRPAPERTPSLEEEEEDSDSAVVDLAPILDEEHQNSDTGFAVEMIDMALAESTKSQYRHKWKHVAKWLTNHHPTVFPDPNNISSEALQSITGDMLITFLGYIAHKRTKAGDLVSPLQYNTPDHVAGYFSAITHQFKSLHVQRSLELMERVGGFLTGYRRKVAKLKGEGKMSMKEGMQPISLVAYQHLAKMGWTQTTDFRQSAFAVTYMTLCWNLMARSNSISGLMLQHLTWADDALVVVFPMHKGDQEGLSCAPRHVYANPSNPTICPILALAVHVWLMGTAFASEKRALFNQDVKSPEHRFSKWILRVRSALSSFGVPDKEIGFPCQSFIALDGGPNVVKLSSKNKRCIWDCNSTHRASPALHPGSPGLYNIQGLRRRPHCLRVALWDHLGEGNLRAILPDQNATKLRVSRVGPSTTYACTSL